MHSYRFYVTIGNKKIGFSKVEGLKTIANFDTISEGGLNGYVHMVKAAVKQNGKLVFESGAYKTSNLDDKYLPGTCIKEPMTVVLTDSLGGISRAYSVESPIVEEWELSGFDAVSSSIIIERFSVIHNGITKTVL